MVDLEGKDRGNISLPPRLQSPDVFDPNFVEDEHAVPIINMQKAFYDIRIGDTEKRIRRLENRNAELLETYEDTEALIDSVDIRSGDHIAYLKKQISTETEKIHETKERMNAISKIREKAKEAHANNVNAANDKYENTRVDLTSAIKALNAKINTLEDYKETRTALHEKLRIRNETMTHNEDEVTQRRDAIDRKFKIDREKLKNEMYSRLLALAGTFQIEISSAITIPVHRLMRENIVMRNELMQIASESLKTKEVYSTMRSMRTVRRNSMISDKRDTTKHLITVKIQRGLINSLKVAHSSMKKRMTNLEVPQEFAQEKYDVLAETVRYEFMAFETRARKLEVLLYRENVRQDNAKCLKNRLESRRNKCEEIIYDVKYAVACALKMTETGEDILNMTEFELYSHLLDLIVRGQSNIRCLVAASSESIPRPDEVYTRGDLGFEPEHIDLERSETRYRVDKTKSLETVSIDIPTVLDERLSTVSLQHDDNEFEKMTRQMRISTDERSEIFFTSPDAESKEESSDVREDNSDAVDSFENEEIINDNEELLSSESGENENA